MSASAPNATPLARPRSRARPRSSQDQYRSPPISMCLGTDLGGCAWSAVGLYDGTLRLEATPADEGQGALGRGGGGGGGEREGVDGSGKEAEGAVHVFKETLQLDGPLTSLAFTGGVGGFGSPPFGGDGSGRVEVTVGGGQGFISLCQIGIDGLQPQPLPPPSPPPPLPLQQNQHQHQHPQPQPQPHQHSLVSMSRVATFDDAVLTVTRHDRTMDGTLDIIAGTADGHIVALTEQVSRDHHTVPPCCTRRATLRPDETRATAPHTRHSTNVRICRVSGPGPRGSPTQPPPLLHAGLRLAG